MTKEGAVSANPMAEIAGLDRLIHEPSRLAILSALWAAGRTSFGRLVQVTGLTRGNLSNHLLKLEEAGFVSVNKSFVNKRPLTTAALTRAGRARVEDHLTRLEGLREDLRAWAEHAHPKKARG